MRFLGASALALSLIWLWDLYMNGGHLTRESLMQVNLFWIKAFGRALI